MEWDEFFEALNYSIFTCGDTVSCGCGTELNLTQV